jgi:hypothetical protein
MIKVVQNSLMNANELLLVMNRTLTSDLIQEIKSELKLDRPATMEDIRPYVAKQFAQLRAIGIVPDDYSIEVWVGFAPATPNLPSSSDTFAPGITVSLPKIDLV